MKSKRRIRAADQMEDAVKKRRPTTWSDIYYRYVRKGEDQLSAGYRADEWERRKQRKQRKQRKKV